MEALFTIIFGGVFGIGFIILGISMSFDKSHYSKIPKPSPLLNNKKYGNYLDGYDKEICGHCGIKRTPEGHDGCIGTLPNVMNACCGHGETRHAYVQFNHIDYDQDPNKFSISGEEALRYINENRVVK